MKKLFYCEEEGNFYFVIQTQKQAIIEWIKHFSCDKRELDQNVRWKNLKISLCEKNTKHCLREFNNNEILVYPFQAGQPFYLTIATNNYIQKEIDYCHSCGVSDKYYKDLIPFLT